MLPSFRIFRISKTRKEFDDCQIKQANAAVVHGRKVLTDNPLPGHVHGPEDARTLRRRRCGYSYGKIDGLRELKPPGVGRHKQLRLIFSNTNAR